jgi:transposase-like protein
MVLHVFMFLLVVCLFLSLARLGRLDWFHFRPSSSRGAAKHSTLHRLLKPRPPDDCPACRLASTHAAGGGPAPVRPWREVKSRRVAPKRVNTEGFACPNQQCPYCGITGAQVHALVGDGKHGHGERIQTFRGPACHTTFSARRHTPLYRLKTPSHYVAMVLSELAERLDPSAAERVFGFRQATITTWLSRAARARTNPARAILLPSPPPVPPIGPLLRTRLRCATEVLWLASDPCTKILPVLQLGPRTQHIAHLVIHALRQSLAAFLPAALHQ